MPLTLKTSATALALSFLASGCVSYPTITSYNDPQCPNIDRHKLELTTTGFSMEKGCDVSCLAGMMTLTGITFTVSGSVVVIGNSALWLGKVGEDYWLKRENKCGNQPLAEIPPITFPTDHDSTPSGAELREKGNY